MESIDKNNICRLCLLGGEDFTYIFEVNDREGFVAASLMKDLLQFKVSKTDGYPPVVCRPCLVKLTEFKHFKEQCITSKVTYDNVFALNEEPLDFSHRSDKTIKQKEVEIAFYSDSTPEEDETEKELTKSEASRKFCKVVTAATFMEGSTQESDVMSEGKCTKQTSKGSEDDSPQECEDPLLSVLDEVRKREVSTANLRMGTEERTSKVEKFRVPQVMGANNWKVVVEQCSDGNDRKDQSKKKKFTCKHCDKWFGYKISLLKHQLTHTKEKPFECMHCEKSFSLKGNLMTHLSTHSGAIPYDCKVCRERFNLKGDLLNHLRTHTENKIHKCQACGKGFGERSKLLTHFRIHSGDKPFHCHTCGMRFNQKNNLTLHLRTHSEDRPYGCDECGRKFKRRDILVNHLMVHSGEKPFQCLVCDMRFSRSCNLITHLKRHNK